MRLSDDLRKCVAFIGIVSVPGDVFDPAGTGFFIAYENFGYFITAQHIAAEFADAPFVIRINQSDGTAKNIHIDPIMDEGICWYNNKDENVDISVLPFTFKKSSEFVDNGAIFINQELFCSDACLKSNRIGIGDICYTIGLFKLMTGEKRNLPIVHTGNIALMPGDEKIPVRDWMAPGQKLKRRVEGYLIENTSIKGLSGSPVFVRPTVDMHGLIVGEQLTEVKETGITSLARADVYLLGIWTNSWDAEPDEVMAIELGHKMRVPLGVWVVIAASKLIEILELPELCRMRAEARVAIDVQNAATPDSKAVI
jgi:hypothetical protein